MIKIIKRSTPIWLPISIWAIMIFYHGVIVHLLTNFWISIEAPPLLGLVLHFLLQLLIICLLTRIAAKGLGYKIRDLRISLPIMYVLFAIFSPMSIYLFAYTGRNPQMPSWVLSILITLQYGIVMLLTTVVSNPKLQEDN